MNREELLYTLVIVIVAGAVTILLRALPFIAFGRKKETPGTVRYLGEVISPAAIAMLTVYCFFCHWQNGKEFYAIPEIIAGVIVIALQYYKGNSLISILVGTVVYMLIIQKF